MHNLVLLDRNSHWAVVGSGLWFVFQSEASPPTANGPFKKAPANTDETSSALLLCSHQQETRRQSCFRCCARLLSLQGGGEGAQLVFFFPPPFSCPPVSELLFSTQQQTTCSRGETSGFVVGMDGPSVRVSPRLWR